jgi:hypothetical protein
MQKRSRDGVDGTGEGGQRAQQVVSCTARPLDHADGDR